MSLPFNSIPNNRAWTHPRITPFRIAFILTTGGLGLAKAVLVSKGKTASSTTVEWITGVVVALIFQLLGSYDSEYNTARPRYLDGLFCYDCLGRSAAPNTPSATDPTDTPGPLRRLSSDRRELPHIVTGYRLLVSIVFAAFGIAKMLCGYLGLSSAMNALDWVIAIPLTLGLYYVGLYEERSAITLRKLFDVDYSSQTLRVCQMTPLYLSSTALCGFWSNFWLAELRSMLAYSDSPSHNSKDTRASATVVWNALFDHLLKWIEVYFSIAMLEVGVVSLGCVLWPMIEVCSGRHVSSLIRTSALPVASVMLYALFFLVCSYSVLFFVFFAAQMFASLFDNPSNIHLFLERVIPILEMIPVAILGGIPAVFVLLKLSKMLMTIGRYLLH